MEPFILIPNVLMHLMHFDIVTLSHCIIAQLHCYITTLLYCYIVILLYYYFSPLLLLVAVVDVAELVIEVV